MIQQSIREFENMKKDLNTNTSIIRLRNTRSHSDRVSLMRLQSFSRDASKSKKFADCEEDDKAQRSRREAETEEDCNVDSRKIARSRCRIESKKICEKTRRKARSVASQDNVGEERERKSKFANNYICPELSRQKPCTWEEERCPETRQKCNENKARVSSKGRAGQPRDLNCSQKQDVDDGRCGKRRQSKSCKQRDDCDKADEPRVVCKDSLKETDDFESKCKKEQRKCPGNNRKRSNSCRKRNSSRTSDKNCSKVDGKRCYSTSDVTKQSIFFVPRDRKSFSTSISDIILGTNVSERFYTSCSKDEKDRRQAPSCEKRRMKCDIKEKEEIEKKCAKGPAKCMSRKKADKTQTCQSTKRDENKKFCESPKKSRQEEFCASRKKDLKKDEKLEKEPVKAPPPVKDKKSMKQLMKEQIDREYKEMDECKKGFEKEKRGDKVKMVSTEYKSTDLNHNLRKNPEKRGIEKFASTRNESIISTDNAFKWFNIYSRIINGTIPIIPKDVGLFNVMFDRSFSTAKLNYQDDFAIERTMYDDKIVRNCSANGDDFIHGDELPNYVEIDYEDEEDDEGEY
ncbi:PREDICTED: axoneme-associated protein mst101(2)-like isoform X1 [Cyphomyrmex costatus]|nr:PREDICTED: axoneme-associated protein mst101(2)-like isoform X1 [Cyphomyrmex costatus]